MWLDKLSRPIIQGGMGVGISLGQLAGTVASQGAMGTISMADIGYGEEDFFRNPREANDRALQREVKKAREIAKGKGLIAVNIMVASRDYDHLVQSALENEIDAIVCGAGLPLSLAELVGDRALIAPIVSSLRALKIILKKWSAVNRLPDFVVVEGPLAGGHLGFKDLEKAQTLEEIVREVAEYLQQENLSIPVFAGGGVRSKAQMEELQHLGAYGIQLGTPFILTKECDASLGFKEKIQHAKESDLEILHSPVGLLARGIRTDFIANKENYPKRSIPCVRCIKGCDSVSMDYCISDYLIRAVKGEDALVFSGSCIEQLREIKTVKDVLEEFQ